MVDELYLRLKNRAFFFHHRKGDIGPTATDFLGGDLQSSTPGQGHRTGLPGPQIETFTAQQAIGGVAEHGLQLSDMALQLCVDTGPVA